MRQRLKAAEMVLSRMVFADGVYAIGFYCAGSNQTIYQDTIERLMAIIDNKILLEFVEQANGPVSLVDMTVQFDDVPQIDILKCIASLKEAGWLVEVERFVWDLSRKSITQSDDVIEGERQERIYNIAKHEKTKRELQSAQKKLRHYPATKLAMGIILLVSIGLTVLIVRKWANE